MKTTVSTGHQGRPPKSLNSFIAERLLVTYPDISTKTRHEIEAQINSVLTPITAKLQIEQDTAIQPARLDRKAERLKAQLHALEAEREKFLTA